MGRAAATTSASAKTSFAAALDEPEPSVHLVVRNSRRQSRYEPIRRRRMRAIPFLVLPLLSACAATPNANATDTIGPATRIPPGPSQTIPPPAVAPYQTQMPPPPPPRAVEVGPRPWTGSRPPPQAQMSLRSLIRAEDYPAAALAARREGDSAVRLTIGPEGRVTNCTVTASARFSALDAATCRLLRSRAQFSPPRDPAGNPTVGVIDVIIPWRLPAGQP